MDLGVYTFADVALSPDGVGPAQRLREVVEEAALADQVGLSVFGVGEHHRADYAVRLRPRRLRHALRGEARPAAGHPRAGSGHVVG